MGKRGRRSKRRGIYSSESSTKKRRSVIDDKREKITKQKWYHNYSQT